MLNEVLREISLESVDCGTDLHKAASENMWSIHVDEDSYKKLSASLLKEFIKNVILALKEKWNKEFTFYCWFDEMAAQIRFCSLKGEIVKLPFSSSIEKTDDESLFATHLFKAIGNQHSETGDLYFRDPLLVFHALVKPK